MQIARHKYVTFQYSLKNDQGTLLDSAESQNPLAYVHGTGTILPALEEVLLGKNPGDDVSIRIPSVQGYGERNESLVFTVSRAKFEGFDHVKPGTRVRVRTPSGEQMLEIVELKDDRVTLDGNHPLAGVDLNFEISVVGVRDCTQEELQQASTPPETVSASRSEDSSAKD